MLRKFFSMDNIVFRIMGRIADFMLVNALFLLCSIPVVTIGASFSALYHVIYKMVEGKDLYIMHDFLLAFKKSFKRATAIWMIFLVVGGMLWVEFYSIHLLSVEMMFIFRVIFVLFAFLYFGSIVFAFSLVGYQDNQIIQIIKNSILIAIGNLPSTILLMVVSLIPIIACVFYTRALVFIMPIMLLGGFALITYLKSLILLRVFRKYGL